MDNQKSFLPFRKFTSLLLVLLLAGLIFAVFAIFPMASVLADTPIFVRVGGNDDACNGNSDVNYTPYIAPNCAVKTMQKALVLAGSTKSVVFTVGSYVTTIPANTGIGMASTTLSIDKSDFPEPVFAGSTLTYTIRVENTGVESATNVIVLDQLPPAEVISFDETLITTSQGNCGLAFADPPTISCTLGIMYAGTAVTVTIPVTPTVAGTTNNVATVSSPDDPGGSRVDQEETRIMGFTDLGITKSDSADPTFVEDPLTYTLTISNNGPTSVMVVTVTDKLPSSVNFVSAIASGGSCNPPVSGIVECTLGLLSDGAQTDITIVVSPTVDGLITNTVSVTGSVFDIDSDNDVATETTIVAPLADLSVSKQDSPDPIFMGDVLTYTVTITNAGPLAVTGITVTDQLPSSVNFVSATASGGTCNSPVGDVVTCTLGALSNGAQTDITIVVSPTVDGLITNTVSITGNILDPDTANNVATETTTIIPTADLSISKSDSSDPVFVADLLTYTLTITNAGPMSVTGITVTDELPSSVNFVSATTPGGSCNPPVSGIVECTLGSLANGAQTDVTIVVSPTIDGLITNVVSVTGNVIDLDTDNNVATETTTVIPTADLSISKSDSSDPIAIGDPLTYTITITNAGPMSVTGITVTDELPSSVNFVSATTPGGSCSFLAGNVVECTLGSLSNGAQTDVTIVVSPTVDGLITNVVSVTGSIIDLDTDNNVATETTTVFPVADLSIGKQDSPDPVFAGDALTYTVTITNAGPMAVTSITVTDELPSSVNFVSATSPGGSCNPPVSGIVECTLGPLSNGAQTDVTIVVNPMVDGLITNVVSVTGSVLDLDTDNNVATETTTVIPAADLSISKIDDPDPVAPGETLTYTLNIINNGPSSAQNVTVTDTLPLSISVSSVDPVNDDVNGQQLIWDLGTLINGESRMLTVTVTVDGAATGNLENSAEVFGSTTDLTTGNNDITIYTAVGSVGGPGTVYLPVIYKNYEGSYIDMQWDGLEPVRDRVSDLDGSAGLVADGDNDGVFGVWINVGSEGPKTVSDINLTSTQGFTWDSLTPNANPVAGVFDGGTVWNNADGTMNGVEITTGLKFVRLYVSDAITTTEPPRFPPDTYTYTLTINFEDGAVLRADAIIPSEAPAVPPTSLAYVSDVTVDEANDLIFAASPRSSGVAVIDGSSNAVVRLVPVGNGPTGLTVLTTTVAANNRVFVAHQYGANYWHPGVKYFGVNETTSYDTSHAGYVGVAPIKIASNQIETGRVYVSNYWDNLAVIDGATGTRLEFVAQRGYKAGYGIDVSSLTNRVYLATRDSGELVVFDGNGDRLLETTYVPTHVKPPQDCTLWNVAVNASTGHVFVPCPELGRVFVLQESQITVLSDLGVLEERDGGLARVVSPAAAPWIADITVPDGVNVGEEGIAIDPATGYVFLTNARNNSVVVLQDGTTPAYVTTVSVGAYPQGVAVNSATERVYVGNAGDNTITVLEVTSPFATQATITLTSP